MVDTLAACGRGPGIRKTTAIHTGPEARFNAEKRNQSQDFKSGTD